ncbi:phospholipase A [Marinobacter halophilus]|uniref:Phospholipase A1 n=1 Tax=Marinobacter halophilus TaxID=1323740 RepID=A0A2T1KJJ5_9GAMM|nr:phospholipase A [Marinobacter halophilus]PSF10299.1 phospholipase [Marinobacter halophilus]GGC69552.1 phospholipase [Marinobacter halophilus]
MIGHLRCHSGLALTFSLGASALAVAQDTPTTEAETFDCALIRDGIQRLACYDARRDPLAARAEADEDAVARAERDAETLAVDDASREELVTSALEDNSDTGVMAALVDNYLTAEKAIFSFSGSFLTHRPNYILPITYVDHPNSTPVSPRLGMASYDYKLEYEEAKYQISFKIPLLTGIFDDRTSLWFGYTQQSYWQVFNTKDSAPFRETNYEPEIFVRQRLNWDLGPGTLSAVSLGFNHQSNGQSEPRSRSWNRIMGSAVYSYNRWLFMVSPWYRLPESGGDDDNPDINRYLGHASYHAVYKLTEDRTFSLKLMNNLRSDNKTSVEFGYSFPMGDTLKGFFQYYNGYGESLIDYNERTERFGIGIMLNNWL